MVAETRAAKRRREAAAATATGPTVGPSAPATGSSAPPPRKKAKLNEESESTGDGSAWDDAGRGPSAMGTEDRGMGQDVLPSPTAPEGLHGIVDQDEQGDLGGAPTLDVPGRSEESIDAVPREDDESILQPGGEDDELDEFAAESPSGQSDINFEGDQGRPGQFDPNGSEPDSDDSDDSPEPPSGGPGGGPAGNSDDSSSDSQPSSMPN